MNIKVQPKIHNRFDIYKKNVVTGEEKQVGYAENIVLDSMWSRLCSGSTYFVNIHYGTGAGTLDPTRTSLFTHLGTGSASTVETVRGIPTSHWRRSITLGLTTANGSELTEVGIAYGSATSNLVTHAQIRDMNGNVVSILKTEVDILTIFATVYITIVNDHSTIRMINPYRNGLLSYLLGGSFPSALFFLDQEDNRDEWGDAPYASLGQSASGSWSSNVGTKTRNMSTVRFNTGVANGHCKDVIFSNIARITIPAAGIYSGLELVGVPIGTGDGVTKTFQIPSRNIDDDSLVVKVNGLGEEGFSIIEPAVQNKFLSAHMNVSAAGNNYAAAYYRIYQNKTLTYGVFASLGGTNSIFVLPARITLNGTPAFYDFFNTGLPLSNVVHTDWFTISEDGSVVGYSKADGNTVFFSARPNIVLPGYHTSVRNAHDISNSGNVVVINNTEDPFLKVYDYVSESWSERPEPVNTRAYHEVVISGDGTRIFARPPSSNEIDVFTWNDPVWNKKTIELTGNIQNVVCKGNQRDKIAVGTASQGVICSYNVGTDDWDIEVIRTGNCTFVDANVDYTRFLAVNGTSETTSNPTFYYSWNGSSWSVLENTFGNYTADIGRYTAACCTRDPSRYMVAGYRNIYSSPTTRRTDRRHYTIGIGILNKSIEFDVAPNIDDVLTADYIVEGIHKTSQRVIDVSGSVQFGEPEE